MNKKAIYIIIVSSLLAIAVCVELFKPKEPDWTMSFSRYSKEPYGNFILHDLMKTIFPRKEIITTHDPVYTVIKDKKYRHYNYFLLNNKCDFEEPDSSALLKFVFEGNNAFIAASIITEKFLDQLGVKTDRYSGLVSSTQVWFVNPGIKRREYNIKQEGGSYFFSKINSNNTTILALNEKNDPVYLQVKYGKGAFYLCTLPLAFTNYCIVSPESAFTFTALSYLPVRNTIWDEFYKIGRIESRTPLRFILKREPLRWAYVTGLAAIVLVIISGVKRKQRIIPVIPPVVNTSLEFVTTVGRLYYQNKDHKNLANKKISYFYDFIRSHLNLETREFNEIFFVKLASKTGLETDEIQKTFSFIESIRKKEHVTEHELSALNNKIDNIYNATRGA